MIETDSVRTIYKWNRLGDARFIANRLFMKIDGNCGLVIPARTTTRNNLTCLIEMIDERR